MSALALPIASKVELALGADLSAHPASWTWTELTYNGATRLMEEQSVQITRGRADESGQIQPAAATMLLENRDGALTPRKATSTYYPYIRRGTPLRYSVSAGVPHLTLTGATNSRASTPDHADFPTGDWFIGIEVEAPIHVSDTVQYEVAGKFNASGNQRSLILYLFDGTPRIRWSTDGTAELTAASTITLPRPIVGTFAFAAWLDVVNGANRVITFYAAATLAAILANPAGTVHETITTAGNTSVFNSTAPFDVGDVTGSGFSPYPGIVRKVQVRAGDSTGTIVTNPDFTAQTVGATSFNDTAPTPKAWTITSPATIDKWQTRFVGQLSEISPVWPTGDIDGTARVKVEASGMLQRLQQGEEPIESAIYRRVTSPQHAANVIAYWPFEDGRDSAQIGSAVSGVRAMGIRGKFSLAADNTLASSKPLMTIASGENTFVSADIPQIPQITGVNWMVMRFVRIDTPTTASPGTSLMAVDTNGRVATWRIALNNVQVTVTGVDEDDVGVVLDTSIATDSRFLGTWAIIALRVTDDGANVDWEAHVIPIPAGLDFSASGTFVGNTGVPYRFRNSMTGPPSGISTGHLIVTTNEALSWLAPADTGFIGERAAARLKRIGAEEGQQITIVGNAASSEPMGAQRAVTFTEMVTECAAADRGVLAELPNAVGLGYRCRNDLYNQTAGLTVDAGLNLVNPFEPIEDDQRIVNEVTVTRTEGSSHKERRQASIDSEGRYPSSAEGNLAADTQLPNHAGWLLHEGTWPEMRYPAVAADLVADSAIHEAWLGTDLGDVVSVTGMPDEHPTTSVKVFIEGITETISSDSWDVSLVNSPAGPLTVGVLNSTSLGKLDTMGSELATGINTTDTSLSVATTLGPLWDPADAEDGFRIVIGGEEMTVTDISGASSPQTFTVTRSANGVVKSHLAGAKVALAQPLVLAL